MGSNNGEGVGSKCKVAKQLLNHRDNYCLYSTIFAFSLIRLL